MTFQSTSQFRQDEAIWLLSGCKTDGNFIDIGCGQPETHSNTCSLERLGWTGVCLDNEKDGPIEWDRESRLIKADAREWVWLSEMGADKPVDYLSIDVDADTPSAVKQYYKTCYWWPRFLTVEHDRYRPGGDERRLRIRETMLRQGYVPLCLDVYPSEQWKQIVWEDWWCAPNGVAPEIHAKLLALHNIEEIIAALYDHRAQNSSDCLGVTSPR